MELPHLPRWAILKRNRPTCADGSLPSVFDFLRLGFAGVASVLLLVFGIAAYTAWTQEHARFLSQAQRDGRHLARDLGRQIQGLRDQVERLAQDPRLLGALKRRDADRLWLWEEDLKRNIPGATQVLLLPVPETGPILIGERGEERGLSYAGLDLVHRARQTRKTPPLEVHQVGRKDVHMALAVPILDGERDRVLGVLSVSVPLSRLAPLDGEPGVRVLLQQRVGEQRATLNIGRYNPPPSGEPDARIPIPGSQLELSLWISPPGFFDYLPVLWGVIAYLLSLALMGGALWIPAQRNRRAFALDLRRLTEGIERGAQDGQMEAPRCRFEETQSLGTALYRAWGQRVQTPAPQAETLPPAPTEPTSEAPPMEEDRSSGTPKAPPTDQQPSQASPQEPERPEEEDVIKTFFRTADEADEAVEVEALSLRELEETAAQSHHEAPKPHHEEERETVPSEATEEEKPIELEPLEFEDIDLDEVLPLEDEGEEQEDPFEELSSTSLTSEEEEFTGRLADITRELFRGYDIRGIAGRDLTPDLSRTLGLAIAGETLEQGQSQVYVGRDTRGSSLALTQSLIKGLRAGGCDVIDLGLVPTPLVYFATTQDPKASGVVVTASHNPPEYNGMKIVIDGESLTPAGLKALRLRLLREEFPSGHGNCRTEDLSATYIGRVREDIAIARTLKIVIDCGNGAASRLAGALYRELNLEVIELNCDPEAGFPNGIVSDPTREECMTSLQTRVLEEGADLGLAFDGDGDRLGIVDSQGAIHWGDHLLLILAADVLLRSPGSDVIFDVKSSHRLPGEILRNGGLPVMWRSGHAHLKAKMAESNALIAGEWSGHLLFRDRWNGFDDALYAGARLLEVLAFDPRPSAEVFGDLPKTVSTSEFFLPMEAERAQALIPQLGEAAEALDEIQVSKIDGVRIAFPEGFGVVRASNTQPALVFRFEGNDEAGLARAMDLIRSLLRAADPDLEPPF